MKGASSLLLWAAALGLAGCTEPPRQRTVTPELSRQYNIPLTTWRPSMPKVACEQNISGWVELLFTVTPQGRVENLSVSRAQPPGLFDATALESVSHWTYAEFSTSRRISQHIEFSPADCPAGS